METVNSMDGGAGTDMLDFSDGSAINFSFSQGAGHFPFRHGTGGLGNGDTYANMEGVIGSATGADSVKRFRNT